MDHHGVPLGIHSNDFICPQIFLHVDVSSLKMQSLQLLHEISTKRGNKNIVFLKKPGPNIYKFLCVIDSYLPKVMELVLEIAATPL